MTDISELGPVLSDLEVAPTDVELMLVDELASLRGEKLVGDGKRLLRLRPGLSDLELAQLRDRLWPYAHVTALYRVGADGSARREALSGSQALDGKIGGGACTLLYLRSRLDALGRDTTVAKFDANAAGWNGVPGSATYGHFRWMRRLLAEVAELKPGVRCLDAGCGAGWVGIEAALLGAHAAAFDPSPAMVEIAKDNAKSEGVELDARVGFVEDVPFKDPFELVLNSGVISFAPDADAYLQSLDELVADGGTLVIGDANPHSRGFARRRRRPLLPARELNALPRDEVEARLGRRGYTITGRWYYQLSFPIPELMTVSEQKWGGFGCKTALGMNKRATAKDHRRGSKGDSRFDSWILRATKPG